MAMNEFVLVIKVKTSSSSERDVETSVVHALLSNECVIIEVVDISATITGRRS